MKPPTIIPTGTAMILVEYPGRKSRDAYVLIRGAAAHCCQCDANGPMVVLEEGSEERQAVLGWMLEHTRLHDPRLRKKVH